MDKEIKTEFDISRVAFRPPPFWEHDHEICTSKDNAYTALKERTISLLSRSENERLRQLLQDLHLGGLRPSQLLSQMKGLAGDKISAQLLRTLWLQLLSIQMQQILSACKDKLPDLASIAHKVHEVSGFSEANAVSLPLTDSVAKLRNEIQQLREEVQ
ncbi:hypothetical protein AVEN_207402-1 [Araneus ventricosus]|uniref:Uncharacterized protein n=1 Tax=Araneus ventricosus TaxID=182803 RepID=A0A4Y2J9D5_ARAVE|nr:hypothetical protein AVEN_207402-1 [Araneus ventricosus]